MTGSLSEAPSVCTRCVWMCVSVPFGPLFTWKHAWTRFSTCRAKEISLTSWLTDLINNLANWWMNWWYCVCLQGPNLNVFTLVRSETRNVRQLMEAPTCSTVRVELSGVLMLRVHTQFSDCITHTLRLKWASESRRQRRSGGEERRSRRRKGWVLKADTMSRSDGRGFIFKWWLRSSTWTEWSHSWQEECYFMLSDYQHHRRGRHTDLHLPLNSGHIFLKTSVFHALD